MKNLDKKFTSIIFIQLKGTDNIMNLTKQSQGRLLETITCVSQI